MTVQFAKRADGSGVLRVTLGDRRHDREGNRGPLPPEADEVEHFVGIFPMPGGNLLSAEEFNDAAGTRRRDNGTEISVLIQ
jgi:hypothetical protein